MSRRFRGGIIGCGFFSQFHTDAWRRMEDVELACACDPQLDRAQAAAARAYQSPEEMLDREQLDFVDVVTRPDTHLELVRAVLARGIPVICQKPMAPTWADCVTMRDEAARTGVPLMIHENWRFQPWYRQAKQLISAGVIGDPVTYRFRIRKRDGNGPEPYTAQPYFRQMPRLLIYETLVHPIDTARFLFGDIGAVFAQTARRNPVIVGEDTVEMVATHASGLSGTISGHRFTDLAPDSPPLGDAEFEGEEGVLTVTARGDLALNGALVWKNTVTAGYRGDSVRATQRHFIDALAAGTAFETSAASYLGTVATVETAYESAAAQSRRNVRPY